MALHYRRERNGGLSGSGQRGSRGGGIEGKAMTSTLFVAIGLAAALLPSLVAVALAGHSAEVYTKLLHPGLLVVSAALALWVALMYRSDLKRAFALLALFLFSYGVLNISALHDPIKELLGSDPLHQQLNFLTLLLVWQVLTYVALLASCAFILRAVGVRRISAKGLVFVTVAVVIGVLVILKGIPTFREYYSVDPSHPLRPILTRFATSLLLIRIFDMAVFLALAPVMVVYFQSARARYQESTTFLIVVIGTVASLSLVYLY
ncbi:MAG: hypothetical protein FJ315_03635, partial [SAR202 cluster bacterium]|nr:hypothetical protein [SAR202 cluster bacterium]